MENLADIIVQGGSTKISAVNVPMDITEWVELAVNGGEIQQVKAESTVKVDGSSKVETVTATAPVDVNSATVDKVEVPANAENVVVNVTGSSEIIIKADSDSTKIAADDTDNITVNGDAKDSITPHTHAWNQGEVTK